MEKLLLLHGAIGSRQQLEPLAVLLRNDYEIHTLNFCGHGGEELPSSFSIPLFADQLLAYINAHQLAPVNIFGYSMGGYVVLYLAAHHPDKIKKIFTFATKFDWTAESAEKESRMLVPEKIGEKIPAFAQTLQQRHAPQDWKKVLALTADMMKEMGKLPPLTDELLGRISIPVKVGVGDNDKMVSMMETIVASGKIKGANMLVMLDTPHPIEQINLERLKAEIRNFF